MIVDTKNIAQKVVHDLHYEDVFPAGALKNAHKAKEDLEPYLIEILEKAIENIKQTEEATVASFYALYLLGEFRSKAAYPTILQIFQLTEEGLDALMGDALTEALARIASACFDGKAQDFFDIFDNQELYLFARYAALEALVILYKYDRITADELIPKIEVRLKKIWQEDNDDAIDSATKLVWVITNARLSPLYDIARETFDLDLVDTFYCDEDFDLEVSEPLDREYMFHKFIDSSYDEIIRWASFSELRAIPLGGYGLKIGRNDKCFCGSGDKFKYCCIL